jgi:hypothetical protein
MDVKYGLLCVMAMEALCRQLFDKEVFVVERLSRYIPFFLINHKLSHIKKQSSKLV